MRFSPEGLNCVTTSSAWLTAACVASGWVDSTQGFELVAETGRIRFSSLFGEKDALMIYSMMYGPERKGPCPM